MIEIRVFVGRCASLRSVLIPAAMRGEQVKAARALLDMSQQDLAEACGVHVATLRDIENETGDPRRSSINQVEDYLISIGVRFISDPLVIGMPVRQSTKKAPAR